MTEYTKQKYFLCESCNEIYEETYRGYCRECNKRICVACDYDGLCKGCYWRLLRYKDGRV